MFPQVLEREKEKERKTEVNGLLGNWVLGNVEVATLRALRFWWCGVVWCV